jgi:signal transduction histidine kinase
MHFHLKVKTLPQTALSENQLMRVETALGLRAAVAGIAQFAAFSAFRFLTPFQGRVPLSIDLAGLCIFLVFIARWALVFLQRTYYPDPRWRYRWKVLFRIVSLTLALSWSCISITEVLSHPESAITLITPLIIIVGIASIAVQAFGLDLLLTRLFVILIIVPTIIALLMFPQPGYLAVATVLSLSLVYLLFLANSSFQLLFEALETRELIQAQRNQVQESARLAALGVMAGGIAHEINNPLQVIRTLAELLKRPLADVPQIATRIEATTDRVAKIIAGLRSFARVGQSYPLSIVDVEPLVMEVAELARISQSQYRVPIEVEPVPLGLTIEGKRAEIGQVLLNLLNNAIDAVKGSEDAWIRIAVKEHFDEVEFRVEDSGPGVSESLLENIMLPFFTTKEVGKGTGLGLSISKSIAEDHHGRLVVDRKVEYTSFVLILPKHQPKTHSAEVRYG